MNSTVNAVGHIHCFVKINPRPEDKHIPVTLIKVIHVSANAWSRTEQLERSFNRR